MKILFMSSCTFNFLVTLYFSYFFKHVFEQKKNPKDIQEWVEMEKDNEFEYLNIGGGFLFFFLLIQDAPKDMPNAKSD